MSHYKSNLRDIIFNLFEVLGRDEILGQGPYEDLDHETAVALLHEVDVLARTRLAASFADGDRTRRSFDPETHTVRLPEAFKRSFRELMDSGVYALELPADLGGQATPPSIQWAVNELITGANPAAYMYAAGPKFATVLWLNGTARDRRIAQIMVERLWGATMVLTEPDAGSDVGAGRTRAIPQPDGSWHLGGRQAVHHLRRARPDREHHASGAGAAGRCRGGRRSRAPRGCRCSSCRSGISIMRPAS